MSGTNLLPVCDAAPPGFVDAQIVMALGGLDPGEHEEAKDQAAQAADRAGAAALPFPEPLSVSPDVIGDPKAPKAAKVIDWRGVQLAFMAVCLMIFLAIITGLSIGNDKMANEIARLESELKYAQATQFEAQTNFQEPSATAAAQKKITMAAKQQQDVLAVYTRSVTAERRVAHLTALLKAYHRLLVENDQPHATQAMLEAIATADQEADAAILEFRVGQPLLELVAEGFTSTEYWDDGKVSTSLTKK